MDFCYNTNLYLTSNDCEIYSKITTVNPYFVMMNKSAYSLIIQQAAAKNEESFPVVLEPGQSLPFFYKNLDLEIAGLQEFMQVRILDEEITQDDLRSILNNDDKLEDTIFPSP